MSLSYTRLSQNTIIVELQQKTKDIQC